MKFNGTITDVIGGMHDSVFIITEFGSDKKWRIEIVHIYPPKPLSNGNVDLCLDGNLSIGDEAIDKKCRVHVEVHDINWDTSALVPEDYIDKQVFVYSACSK